MLSILQGLLITLPIREIAELLTGMTLGLENSFMSIYSWYAMTQFYVSLDFFSLLAMYYPCQHLCFSIWHRTDTWNAI